ncbi:AT-rich interactive domain-containing protein 5B-like isoform X2 [Euwallacea similis]|uniref:AT-rich interactive domain-containing protein 5B-like isoform X2 n=1 Tax=Euwallacea similis TaxID=1736056 RepID=UPI00344F181B
MDISDVQLVGGPCGQHGPYTFYKAFKYAKSGVKKLITLSEFFFVKMWRDSDLLCIGELQLLWTDKNSEQTLTSLRLYFLPENTPEGRMDQGEDEVLAISEKVVIRLEDLITWITVETEWNWGRLAKCEEELKSVSIDSEQLALPRKPAGNSFTLSENTMDFSDVEQERDKYEPPMTGPHVIILSFPKYCRYRAMMKRLEGVEDFYLKYKIVNALGGFYVKHPNTRVLFCRDTFDYPELEGHELLCNHLAPKLKGRPRGRRKKRSASPGSESNESESSVSNHFARITERSNGVCSTNSSVATRRSTRCHENNENKQFMKVLSDFMKAKQLPMGRVPSLGYKELNLHEFYTRVQKLGGYECVTTNRLWKSIFDDMTGHLNSTSAATIIRRHYERFLLAYERHEKGEEDKPIPSVERRRLKNKQAGLPESASSDSDSAPDTPSTSRSSTSPPVPETTAVKDSPSPSGKTSTLRSIRVKPERQKDKSNGESQKTISETTSVLPDQIPSSPIIIKSEPEDFKSINTEKCQLEEMQLGIRVEVKVETNVTVEVKVEELSEDVKREEEKIKEEEPDGMKPSIPEGTKTEGSILPEPITNAVAPVVTVAVPEKNLSPMEGKETSPATSKIGETPKESASVTSTASARTDSIKREDDASLRDVKRIKLDILKEGGLEVTPVKSTSTTVKEFRPSVIQSPAANFPIEPSMGPPPLLSNVLPKRSPPSLPASINITQIKAPAPPSTPVKSESFQFLNGATPPKVVQSRSIYTYSEKVVYGNPKDIFQPSMMSHTPKSMTSSAIRQSSGDPMDLSLTSPQKPAIEVMPMPQNYSTTAQTSFNRASVTKNLYKTTPPLPDGRKLGPNLEITLVNPKQCSTASRGSNKRSGSETYAQKIAKLKSDELRHSKYNSGMYKSAAEVPAPNHHYMKSSSALPKPDLSKHKPPVFPPQMHQPYLSRFVPPETPGPFIPLMEPFYYQAALQNVYSNLSNMPHPMLPIPTPEQLKFYADLMAHNRFSMPFGHPGDSSMNNGKKP